MVRIIALGFMLILLGGCQCTPTAPEIQYQKVEVAVPVQAPEPPVIINPTLEISKITDSTPDDEIVKLYEASIEQLKGHVLQLQKVLDGYRHK